MTRIIQISDPHIVPHGQLAYGQVDPAAALAHGVETINRILPDIGPVDMVVVAGDLTDFGTEEEYQRFRKILEPLDVPYRAVPGNHDNVNTMRACFSDQPWMPSEGPINWAMEFDDLALIGLDSSVPMELTIVAGGEISARNRGGKIEADEPLLHVLLETDSVPFAGGGSGLTAQVRFDARSETLGAWVKRQVLTFLYNWRAS